MQPYFLVGSKFFRVREAVGSHVTSKISFTSCFDIYQPIIRRFCDLVLVTSILRVHKLFTKVINTVSQFFFFGGGGGGGRREECTTRIAF